MAWYSLGILIIILCPVTAGIIIKYGIGESVYWRMFWLLPIIPVLAYLMTEGIGILKNKAVKIIVAVIFCGIIIYNGNCMYTSGLFQKSGNPFKLPDEAVVISNVMRENSGDGEIKAMVPVEMTPYIRQYDAGIKLAFGRESGKDNRYDTPESLILFDTMTNKTPDYASFYEALKMTGCNYVVVDTEDTFTGRLLEEDFTDLGTYGKYVVLYIGEDR